MKLPNFHNLSREWDRFKAFHAYVGNSKFVQFETGELMTTHSYWKPYQRIHYSDLNVSVTSPRDGKFKFALPDGTECPAAWLTQSGAPFLLIDHDSKRAVNMSWRGSDGRDKLPKHLQHATAWFNASGAEPLSLSKIKISSPYKMSKDEKDWAKKLKQLCGVYTKARGIELARWDKYRQVMSQEDLSMSPTDVFAGLNDNTRARIAFCGLTPSRVPDEVDYLVVTNL